ncbi:hypothetical protein phiA829_102 [Aeromonas phage phiA8-29]|uniref:Uncharacterized protein n=1 Tax=Aeromonas phage phiA8-29 TaxID=1978922 RepID=A0A1W6DYS0_9CAUD|nr:hypothetical protein HWB15_gp175 [Aeromonas phage phiA8-29]ARK07922.1 hypothetical protein phiA829_102 [Aeromonas phage phiA8-29]
MSTEIKILQKVFRAGDQYFRFEDISSMRRTPSDGKANVRFKDDDTTGWFECSQEDFDALGSAWDNYLEKEKTTNSLKQIKTSKL